MTFISIISAACSFALFTATTAAYGAVTYVYTGNPFDTFIGTFGWPGEGTSVTVTIVLDSPLQADLVNESVAPARFTVSDGAHQITQETAASSFSIFLLTTILPLHNGVRGRRTSQRRSQDRAIQDLI